MKYIYDLDDVFCENKAKEAVKHEIINILESSKNNSVDIKELFEQARNNIISSISINYLNNLYQDYNHFESDEATSLDKERKNSVETYNGLKKLRQIFKDLLDRGLYRSNDVKTIKKELEKIEPYIEAEETLTLVFERQISTMLYHKSPIKSIAFNKADNGKYSIGNYLKPYLDRITFDSLPMSSTNIENYDFTGTKGIRIQSWNIKNNTLSNANLSGVTINCYKNDYLYAIDPTKINVTGTNFTGSKGAVVTLENTKELPENCNLTDAIIVVNSKDDIRRLNLEKYKEKVYIKQDSIIANDKVIDIDFNDYLNYTGVIDNIEINSINEALKPDGANNEEIRVENNKIISYIIASEIANTIDFNKLLTYLNIIKTVNEYIEEHPEMLDKKRRVMKEYLYETHKKVGSPIYESCKFIDKDCKTKIHTNHGVLTIDSLRLGLSKEELELMFKGEKKVELGDTAIKFIIMFDTLYDYVIEIENKENEDTLKDEESSSLNNTVLNTISIYNKSFLLQKKFINLLENLIYNNLEENNKGYSYAIKKQ